VPVKMRIGGISNGSVSRNLRKTGQFFPEKRERGYRR
jgi:hypothetical protein